jgi:predicted nucleotidyltransferase
MKVDRKETLAGLKMPKIRDFLMKIGGLDFTSAAIHHFFKADEDRGREIELALLNAGFIESDPLDGKNFVLTDLGSRLKNAKFISRINREKADRIVAEFMARVEAVNADNDLTHKVVGVRVFGSYLGDSDDLGDIDLAVSFKFRGSGSIVEASNRRADLSGRDLGFFQRLTYGQTEVFKLVKGRNQYVSMHEYDDPVDLGVPFKDLFPKR